MICPSRLISILLFLFLDFFFHFHFSFRCFVFVKGASRLNATNTTGLDEYVDILQVQQLLLDSSSSIATSSSASTIPAISPATSTATSSAARHRPRVNIQKATDYSAAAIAAAASTTTASVNQVQGKWWHTNKTQKSHSSKKKKDFPPFFFFFTPSKRNDNMRLGWVIITLSLWFSVHILWFSFVSKMISIFIRQSSCAQTAHMQNGETKKKIDIFSPWKKKHEKFHLKCHIPINVWQFI